MLKKLNPSLGWTELIKAAASNGHECFEVNLVIMVASALAILFRKWTMRKTRRREARRGEQLLATERKWIQSVHIIASSKSPITRARRRRGTTSMYPPYMVNSLAASVAKKYRRSGALCAVRKTTVHTSGYPAVEISGKVVDASKIATLAIWDVNPLASIDGGPAYPRWHARPLLKVKKMFFSILIFPNFNLSQF